MAQLEELTNLKKKVGRLQRERDRAEGALSETMKRIKEEFECSTLEEAETLLKKLKRKEDKAKNKFEEALAKFKEEWSELL